MFLPAVRQLGPLARRDDHPGKGTMELLLDRPSHNAVWEARMDNIRKTGNLVLAHLLNGQPDITSWDMLKDIAENPDVDLWDDLLGEGTDDFRWSRPTKMDDCLNGSSDGWNRKINRLVNPVLADLLDGQPEITSWDMLKDIAENCETVNCDVEDSVDWRDPPKKEKLDELLDDPSEGFNWSTKIECFSKPGNTGSVKLEDVPDGQPDAIRWKKQKVVAEHSENSKYNMFDNSYGLAGTSRGAKNESNNVHGLWKGSRNKIKIEELLEDSAEGTSWNLKIEKPGSLVLEDLLHGHKDTSSKRNKKAKHYEDSLDKGAQSGYSLQLLPRESIHIFGIIPKMEQRAFSQCIACREVFNSRNITTHKCEDKPDHHEGQAEVSTWKHRKDVAEKSENVNSNFFDNFFGSSRSSKSDPSNLCGVWKISKGKLEDLFEDQAGWNKGVEKSVMEEFDGQTFNTWSKQDTSENADKKHDIKDDQTALDGAKSDYSLQLLPRDLIHVFGIIPKMEQRSYSQCIACREVFNSRNIVLHECKVSEGESSKFSTSYRQCSFNTKKKQIELPQPPMEMRVPTPIAPPADPFFEVTNVDPFKSKPHKKNKIRRYDPDVHCGVVEGSKGPCTRSITCTNHRIQQKKLVERRNKDIHQLIAERKAAKEKELLKLPGYFEQTSPQEQTVAPNASTPAEEKERFCQSTSYAPIAAASVNAETEQTDSTDLEKDFLMMVSDHKNVFEGTYPPVASPTPVQPTAIEASPEPFVEIPVTPSSSSSHHSKSRKVNKIKLKELIVKNVRSSFTQLTEDKELSAESSQEDNKKSLSLVMMDTAIQHYDVPGGPFIEVGDVEVVSEDLASLPTESVSLGSSRHGKSRKESSKEAFNRTIPCTNYREKQKKVKRRNNEIFSQNVETEPTDCTSLDKGLVRVKNIRLLIKQKASAENPLKSEEIYLQSSYEPVSSTEVETSEKKLPSLPTLTTEGSPVPFKEESEVHTEAEDLPSKAPTLTAEESHFINLNRYSKTRKLNKAMRKYDPNNHSDGARPSYAPIASTSVRAESDSTDLEKDFLMMVSDHKNVFKPTAKEASPEPFVEMPETPSSSSSHHSKSRKVNKIKLKELIVKNVRSSFTQLTEDKELSAESSQEDNKKSLSLVMMDTAMQHYDVPGGPFIEVEDVEFVSEDLASESISITTKLPTEPISLGSSRHGKSRKESSKESFSRTIPCTNYREKQKKAKRRTNEIFNQHVETVSTDCTSLEKGLVRVKNIRLLIKQTKASAENPLSSEELYSQTSCEPVTSTGIETSDKKLPSLPTITTEASPVSVASPSPAIEASPEPFVEIPETPSSSSTHHSKSRKVNKIKLKELIVKNVRSSFTQLTEDKELSAESSQEDNKKPLSLVMMDTEIQHYDMPGDPFIEVGDVEVVSEDLASESISSTTKLPSESVNLGSSRHGKSRKESSKEACSRTIPCTNYREKQKKVKRRNNELFNQNVETVPTDCTSLEKGLVRVKNIRLLIKQTKASLENPSSSEELCLQSSYEPVTSTEVETSDKKSPSLPTITTTASPVPFKEDSDVEVHLKAEDLPSKAPTLTAEESHFVNSHRYSKTRKLNKAMRKYDPNNLPDEFALGQSEQTETFCQITSYASTANSDSPPPGMTVEAVAEANTNTPNSPESTEMAKETVTSTQNENSDKSPKTSPRRSNISADDPPFDSNILLITAQDSLEESPLLANSSQLHRKARKINHAIRKYDSNHHPDGFSRGGSMDISQQKPAFTQNEQTKVFCQITSYTTIADGDSPPLGMTVKAVSETNTTSPNSPESAEMVTEATAPNAFRPKTATSLLPEFSQSDKALSPSEPVTQTEGSWFPNAIKQEEPTAGTVPLVFMPMESMQIFEKFIEIGEQVICLKSIPEPQTPIKTYPHPKPVSIPSFGGRKLGGAVVLSNCQRLQSQSGDNMTSLNSKWDNNHNVYKTISSLNNNMSHCPNILKTRVNLKRSCPDLLATSDSKQRQDVKACNTACKRRLLYFT